MLEFLLHDTSSETIALSVFMSLCPYFKQQQFCKALAFDKFVLCFMWNKFSIFNSKQHKIEKSEQTKKYQLTLSSNFACITQFFQYITQFFFHTSSSACTSKYLCLYLNSLHPLIYHSGILLSILL